MPIPRRPAERHERTLATTIRAQSAYRLSTLSPIAEDVIAPLRSALKDPEPYVRANAISALAELGTPAMTAIPDLEAVAKAAKDEGEKESVTKAIETLKAAKPDSAKGVKERIEAIHKIKANRS